MRLGKNLGPNDLDFCILLRIRRTLLLLMTWSHKLSVFLTEIFRLRAALSETLEASTQPRLYKTKWRMLYKSNVRTERLHVNLPTTRPWFTVFPAYYDRNIDLKTKLATGVMRSLHAPE